FSGFQDRVEAASPFIGIQEDEMIVHPIQTSKHCVAIHSRCRARRERLACPKLDKGRGILFRRQLLCWKDNELPVVLQSQVYRESFNEGRLAATGNAGHD